MAEQGVLRLGSNIYGTPIGVVEIHLREKCDTPVKVAPGVPPPPVLFALSLQIQNIYHYNTTKDPLNCMDNKINMDYLHMKSTEKDH